MTRSATSRPTKALKSVPAMKARKTLVLDTDTFLNGGPVAGNRADLLITDGIKSADEILADMAKTFKERNAVYGSNYRMVAKLVAVLFPHGVPSDLVITDQWHLFELILVKLSRFAISNLTHRDSIHDSAVYGAMIESILSELESQQQ